MTSFEIPPALAGERVDRAVALLTGRSRSEVAALVEGAMVLLDGSPVGSAHVRVRAGQQLEVALADQTPTNRQLEPRPDVDFTVVYEDDDVIVVDKPAGLVVHPGAAHERDTLIAGLLARYPDLALLADDAAPERPGIVHRLDKETSGLLVVARTESARSSLSAQLAEHSMGRTYLALAKGSVEADEGTIEAPIGRSLRNRTKMAVRSEGRYARTSYRVLERYSAPEAVSFVECALATGRTHQIRVHLAAIGHPVVGDRQYGGSAPRIGLNRPFLHAAHIRFIHPATATTVEFSSELPPDLATLLERLEPSR